jgi:hypothetical protein
MKTLLILVITLAASCGSPVKKTGPIINSTPRTKTLSTTKPTIGAAPTLVKPPLPTGAIIGNYNGDLKPFYAKINKVDTKKGITTIGFQNKKYPNVVIPETYGGTVSPLILDGFDRDLLLVTAKLDDPNFNKYFLYILRNNNWKPVINGFSIHKSNAPETLQVIRVNPKKPNELIRYYSVFNLDESSDLGYAWALREESVVKVNW